MDRNERLAALLDDIGAIIGTGAELSQARRERLDLDRQAIRELLASPEPGDNPSPTPAPVGCLPAARSR